MECPHTVDVIDVVEDEIEVVDLPARAEMPSPYRFTDDSIRRLTRQWMEAIDRDISHPCIIAWVPFNESWGVPDLPLAVKGLAVAAAVWVALPRLSGENSSYIAEYVQQHRMLVRMSRAQTSAPVPSVSRRVPEVESKIIGRSTSLRAARRAGLLLTSNP